jgi:DNA ligase-4
MVLECQQHPDYYHAIRTLLDLAEQYSDHATRLARGGTGAVMDARSGLAKAEADLKTLIERFANGTSTDDLWASISRVYDAADDDPQLKNWLKELNRYVRRCLQEQGYILEEESNIEWELLYDEGHYLLRDKYRGHTDRVVDEIKFLVDQFDQDPHNKAFAASLTKLFTDLGNDENGKPTFKPHLIKDLTDVILPAAFEKVAYIPVPRIEYSDSQFDAVIENLVLESDNFMPNVLEIASENYMRFGRKKVASDSKHSIEVKVSGIQMDLRDVSYYIKRKQGFPAITDKGVANLLLAGEGFTFRMKLSSPDKSDKRSFFKIDKVDVAVNNLKIKLVQSNHKRLFSLFKPLMLKVLRPGLQKAMEKAIKDQATELDTVLYQIKQEADRTLEKSRADPDSTPNIYSRYVNAAQKRLLQSKKKAAAAAAVAADTDKKVNYAVSKEHSIFPNIHLPGGISSKAAEYRELARKGDAWESPVFSIGMAAQSRDIPPAPRVVRKPHRTAAAAATLANGGGTTANGGPTQGGGARNGSAVNGNAATRYDGTVVKGGVPNGSGANRGFRAHLPAFDPNAEVDS